LKSNLHTRQWQTNVFDLPLEFLSLDTTVVLGIKQSSRKCCLC